MKRTNQHFRELPSTRFGKGGDRLTADFRKFVGKEVLPHVNLFGYKLDAQRVITTQIIHQLVCTGLVGKCVADDRNTHHPGVRQRAKVWDAVVEAGFADLCLGSESSGMVARYRATSKLLALRRSWKLPFVSDLHLERDTAMATSAPDSLVYIHTGKFDMVTGEPLPQAQRKQSISHEKYLARNAQPGPDGKPDPLAIKNGMEYLQAIEDELRRINFANYNHTWHLVTPSEGKSPHVRPINFCVKQLHSGRMFRGGRLYTWGEFSAQNLPKELRRLIRLDGEEVAELDFSGMAPRMLYHLEGHDPQGDIYQPETILPKFYDLRTSKAKQTNARNLVKKVTNICLNVPSRQKALAATRMLLREWKDRDWAGAGKFVRRLVYGVESSSPEDLLRRIQDAHPKVSHRFFTEVGIDLMTYDGQIMFRILGAFATANKPALGIHDAVLCKVSDLAFAEKAMRACYREMIGFAPVIRRVY